MASVLGFGAIVGVVTSVLVQKGGTSIPLLIGLIICANVEVLLAFSGVLSFIKAMRGSAGRISRYVISGVGIIVGLFLIFTSLAWAGAEPSAEVPPPSKNEGKSSQKPLRPSEGSTDNDDLAVRSLGIGEKTEGSALTATIVNRRDHPIVLKRIYWVLQAARDFECPEGYDCYPAGDRYSLDPVLFSVGDGKHAGGSLSVEGGGLDGFKVHSEVVLSRGYSKVFAVGFDANLTLAAKEVRDLVLVLPVAAAVVEAYPGDISGWLLPEVNQDQHPNVHERDPGDTLSDTPGRAGKHRPIKLCLDGTPEYHLFAASTESDKWASAYMKLESSSMLVC